MEENLGLNVNIQIKKIILAKLQFYYKNLEQFELNFKSS